MAQVVQSPSRGPGSIGRFGIGLTVAFAAIYAFVRTPQIAPGSDDIAVWIRVHEALSRGGTLYETVWDHKDPGFFLVSEIPYELWSVTGLYVVGFALVGAFGAGVFLFLRRVTAAPQALFLSAIAVVLYVAPQTYYSVFVPHQAVALLVLAAGLSFRYPVIAGAVFAISIAVKLSGLVPLALVFACYLAFALFVRFRRPSLPADRRWLRLGLGFLGMGAMVVGLVAAIGALPGWVDITAYNAQYARIQGNADVGPDSLVRLAQMSWPLRNITGAALLAGLLAIGLLLVWLRRRLTERASADTAGQATAGPALEPIVVAAAVLVGAVITMLPQELYLHHFQYLYGPLVLFSVLCYACLVVAIGLRQLLAAGAPLILAAVLVVATAVSGQPNSTRSLASGLSSWSHLNDGVHLNDFLQQLPPEVSTIAVYGTNGYGIDLRSTPQGVQLGCRFHFQFSHMLARYGPEMAACLDNHPDVVVWEAGLPVTGSEYGEFRAGQLQRLARDYVVCQQPDPIFTVYGRTPQMCPLGTATASGTISPGLR